MEERNVIWIAGYPKSGNTWVASILEVAGRPHAYPQGNYDVYGLQTSGMLPEPCPAVSPRFRNRPCSILKTHACFHPVSLPHRLLPLQLVNAGFIHICRNPLDVLLSYISFTRIEYEGLTGNANYKRQIFRDLLGFSADVEYPEWRNITLDAIPQRNLDHALDHFSSSGLRIETLGPMSGSWVEHVESWKQAAMVLPGHSLRYEDCVRNTAEFSRLTDMFVFDEADIDRAVAYVNERTIRLSRTGSAQERMFYNRMRAGYFQDFFSPAAVQRFIKNNEVVLARAGYADLAEYL